MYEVRIKIIISFKKNINILIHLEIFDTTCVPKPTFRELI